jgi:hypothetical protein
VRCKFEDAEGSASLNEVPKRFINVLPEVGVLLGVATVNVELE